MEKDGGCRRSCVDRVAIPASHGGARREHYMYEQTRPIAHRTTDAVRLPTAHSAPDSLLALLLAESMMLVLAWQYAHSTSAITPLGILASLVAGLFVGDLAVGLLHIMIDHMTIRADTSPYLRDLCLAFQAHHRNPKTLIQETHLDLLRQTSLVQVPFFVILMNALCEPPKGVILTQNVAFHAMHWAQVIHRGAHFMNHASDAEKRTLHGQVLAFLQKTRLILSPNEHRAHHGTRNHDINFCLVNGWANPFLNFLVKRFDLVNQIRRL
jgi:hypothetical protein